MPADCGGNSGAPVSTESVAQWSDWTASPRLSYARRVMNLRY
jgi:hypothetical protein